MKEIVLNAKRRDVVGKQVKALRREGLLPAVLYSRHLSPIIISLDMRDASRVLPTITSSHLVVVDVEGEKHTTLVREKQRHPVTRQLVARGFPGALDDRKAAHDGCHRPGRRGSGR